MHSYTDIKLPV